MSLSTPQYGLGSVSPSYKEEPIYVGPVTAVASGGAGASYVITFAAVPANVAVGMHVADSTHAAYLTSGTYVIALTATTVQLSMPIVTTVTGDTISFTGGLLGGADGILYVARALWTDVAGTIVFMEPDGTLRTGFPLVPGPNPVNVKGVMSTSVSMNLWGVRV